MFTTRSGNMRATAITLTTISAKPQSRKNIGNGATTTPTNKSSNYRFGRDLAARVMASVCIRKLFRGSPAHPRA